MEYFKEQNCQGKEILSLYQNISKKYSILIKKSKKFRSWIKRDSRKAKKKQFNEKKGYNTAASHVVSHHTTDAAQ